MKVSASDLSGWSSGLIVSSSQLRLSASATGQAPPVGHSCRFSAAMTPA